MLRLGDKGVIFLDIDGVMVLPQGRLSREHEGIEFDKESVAVLKEVVSEGGGYIKIVISSSRGEIDGLSKLKKLFSYYGLDNLIEGKTDNKGDKEGGIKRYIEEKSIKNYVVIDDVKIDIDRYIPTKLRVGLKEYKGKERQIIRWMYKKDNKKE